MEPKYARLVTLAAWTAMVVATLLMVVKLAAWWHTSSVSLLASLIDSLLDMAASLINLVIIRYALQPADHEHSFGHGKAESLAALAQSTFISGSACFLLLSGVERLMRPGELVDPQYGVGVSVFAIVITGALVMFQRKVIQLTNSQAIAADSLHYQSDLLMNFAIVVALGISWAGWPVADALFAIGIGVYILVSAFRIGYEAVQSLLDRQLPDEELAEIKTLALSVERVQGVHQLRTRQSGPVRFIQLHLELDDELLLIEAHRIADEVELGLKNRFPGADIIIHQDPLSVVPVAEKNELNGDRQIGA